MFDSFSSVSPGYFYCNSCFDTEILMDHLSCILKLMQKKSIYGTLEGKEIKIIFLVPA